MKLRSLYHKPKGERGIGKWIVGWTWFLALFYSKGKALKYNYSHEELQIPNSLGKFKMYGKPVGQCFSSTTRGAAEGVRFAPASEVLHRPERWEYIEFEVDDFTWEYIVLPKLKGKVGNKYDFVAVATGFVTPVLIDDEEMEYCSGICCWVKYLLNILPKWWKRISPRRSAFELAKDWGEPRAV